MNKNYTAESYNAQAAQYDERWKGYLVNTHQRLLREFDTDPLDRLLDLSAGTGFLAELLQQREDEFREFILNDLSSKMLEIAQKKLRHVNNISFTGHSADKLGFQSNSFDQVISMNAFHNYPDQVAVFREVHRVLKPGGNFYLLDWNREGLFKVINYWIDKLTNETIQTVTMGEAIEMLTSHHFDVHHKEKWSYRYWNLFLIKGVKQPI
ncbi:class I SAM-dependent methyltransferase [Gracilimonas sp.]|uniref:class I SAM-dependent methyltransferase n=1 Tax=Gracilimonas sp. TaxID=1974203 RepID=UPI0032EDA37B